MRWFGVALLAWVGCRAPEPNIKPPLHEEYNLPPAEDARFSSPIAYPKETMNQDGGPRKDPNAQPGAAFKGSRGGLSSGGMGSGY
jgi:hypothetical protein